MFILTKKYNSSSAQSHSGFSFISMVERMGVPTSRGKDSAPGKRKKCRPPTTKARKYIQRKVCLIDMRCCSLTSADIDSMAFIRSLVRL